MFGYRTFKSATLFKPADFGRRCPPAGGTGQWQVLAAGAQLPQQYAQLAAALAPGTLLKADYTPLGRGLVATQPVVAGTLLLAVDWANMMCVTDDPRKAGNEFGKRVVQDWQLVHQKLPPLLASYILSGESGDWFLRLTAWMLFLKTKVDRGPLTLYRQLLPQAEEMSCLMNFLPEERAALQSPSLEAAAQKERDDILGVHERVFGGAAAELRALQLAGDPGDTLWAACCVNSRCFSETVNGEVVSLVVPCADMANHQNSPNAVYAFSAARDCFELTSLRDIAVGEEVCISYGCQHKANDELMRDYGFVIHANPNDRIPFATGDDVYSRLMSGGSMAGAAAAAINANRLREAVQPSSAASSRLSAAAASRLPAVLASLRPFLRPDSLPAGQAAAQDQAAAEAAAPPGGEVVVAGAALGEGRRRQGRRAPAPPPSEAELAGERQAVAQLREQCAQLLAAHGTSIAMDEGVLRGEGAQGEGMSARVRQAVECRLERKRLIGSAAEVLEAYAESLR